MSDNETADAMRVMAEKSVALAEQLEFDLDFAPDSIGALEGYLAEIHEYLLTPECTWTEHMIWSAARNMGAYFGEVLRRNLGGDWVAGTIENPMFVIGHVELTPCEKVWKRLTNGLEDHIGHYYQSILTCLSATDGDSGIVVVG